MFLSRDDHSGTNIKEQKLWAMSGRAPWEGDSPWYYKYHVFPKEALLKADEMTLYTITDKGTWLNNKNAIKNSVIYVQGGAELLNPCFALLTKKPTKRALDFLNYLKSKRAQALLETFGKDRLGEALFTPADRP